MTAIFNTGNNAPLQRGVLADIARLCVDLYKCGVIGPIGDAGGRFAFRMTTPEDEPFLLVAKGSRLWTPPEYGEPVVSVQRQLLVTASMISRRLVLAYRPDPRAKMFVSWYRFDPEFVLKYGFETNKRSPESGKPQTKMWNFPLRLGEEIEGPHEVYKGSASVPELGRPVEQRRLSNGN